MSTPLENVQSDTISSNTPKDQVPSPVYIKCKVIVARHLFLSQDSQPIKPNPATARTKADGSKKKTSSGIPSLQLEPLQTKKAANAPASLSQDSQPTKIKPSYSQNKDRQVKKNWPPGFPSLQLEPLQAKRNQGQRKRSSPSSQMKSKRKNRQRLPQASWTQALRELGEQTKAKRRQWQPHPRARNHVAAKTKSPLSLGDE